MKRVTQESAVSLTLTMLAGFISFSLALAIVFLAVYTLLHTGHSILGEITIAPMGWPHP